MNFGLGLGLPRFPLGTGGSVFAYNLKASNTTSLRAGLAAVRAGSADAIIGLSDDSTGRGKAAADGNDFRNGWLPAAMRKAEADGLFNTFWSSIWGTGNMTGGDDRWANVGGTTNPSGQGLGYGLWSMTTAGSGMTFAPGVAADTFDLWHYDNNTMAFDANLDGGANTRVDSTAGFRATRLTGTLDLHTVNVAMVNTGVRFMGVSPFNSTRKQVLSWNFCTSGTKASDHIGTTQPFAVGSLATSIAPLLSAIIIGFSINERQQNVSPTDYKAAMQTLINLYKAGNPGITVILKTPVPSGSTGLTYEQVEYVAKIYELANENDFPVIQVYEAMQSYAVSNALGRMIDTLHCTTEGYRFIGEDVVVPVFRRALALAA